MCLISFVFKQIFFHW